MARDFDYRNRREGVSIAGSQPGAGSLNRPRAGLRDLLHFSRADAGSAHAQAAAGAVDDGANCLQIQIPAALGNVMGVTDTVAELRTAAAHFANSCHDEQSP